VQHDSEAALAFGPLGMTHLTNRKPRQLTGAVSRMRAMSPECRTL
jgi:hypothetical protein